MASPEESGSYLVSPHLQFCLACARPALASMPEMQVQIPAGVAPGGQMQVMTAQGPMMVQVPPDKKPGDMFTFMVPDAPAAPVVQPMAQPAMGTVVGQPATVIMQQVAPMQPVMAPVHHTHVFYGRHSTRITCPTHGVPSNTNTTFEAGLGTWMWCVGLCLVGCDLGCCFIPFCLDDTKDVKHHCSNCGTFVGEKKVCG